jgi:hypothetical protein
MTEPVAKPAKAAPAPRAKTPASKARRRSSGGRARPTARQIAAARLHQGPFQKPRKFSSAAKQRAFEIGAKRPQNVQPPLKLSPEERRAFEIGSRDPRYQKHATVQKP